MISRKDIQTRKNAETSYAGKECSSTPWESANLFAKFPKRREIQTINRFYFVFMKNERKEFLNVRFLESRNLGFHFGIWELVKVLKKRRIAGIVDETIRIKKSIQNSIFRLYLASEKVYSCNLLYLDFSISWQTSLVTWADESPPDSEKAKTDTISSVRFGKVHLSFHSKSESRNKEK
jgi:hypothetical protein